jgi:hypothetical protein
VIRRTAIVATACCGAMLLGASAAEKTPAGKGAPARRPGATSRSGSAAATTQPAFTPTSGYERRDIEGFKSIYVHRDLLGTRKALGDEVLRVLTVKLYEVSRVVPAAALTELRKVPIWMEHANPKGGVGCYHPSRRWLQTHGYNPAKARSIEFGNARTFLRYVRTQPWMVLHELAHAYQDRALPGGYGNKQIKAAYERAKASKTYDSVLYYDGRERRAYGMNNPMEYFAELSEAYFGTNDMYPFVQAELKVHDPAGYALLRKLWGIDRD